MNKTNGTSGLKVRTHIKAGGFSPQHNRAGLKIRTSVKAGGFSPQHNRPILAAI